DSQTPALLPPEEAKRWPARRGEVEAATTQAAALEEKRYDPASRKKLRDLIVDNFGLSGQIGLLHAQGEYLNNDGTAAALDNELTLLWWGYYNRSNWLVNPLHYRNAAPAGEYPPVLMV